MNIGLIGCGNICTGYGDTLKRYPELKLIGATDLDLERAQKFTATYGGKAYASIDEILADPKIDTILNLTIHHAHYEVISKALAAGKHVFTEKPMAVTYEEAADLVRLAKQHKVRLASAPITFMGECEQTAMMFLKSGKIGPVRIAYAEVNWGQIERWHPNPAPFYKVGPVMDVGVYALSVLTSIFGPAKEVRAFTYFLKKQRTTKSGAPFEVESPDYSTAMITFHSGEVCRLTSNFYVTGRQMHHGIQFHGDEGSLHLGDYHNFEAPCYYGPYGEPYSDEKIFLREPTFEGVDRALGLHELNAAIQQNRPHRGSAEHAAHVIEIMESIDISSDESRTVVLQSSFEAPKPMEWAVEAARQRGWIS